jgi:hypothetical protein
VRRQSRIGEASGGKELRADEPLRISQVRAREVAAIEPRHTKIGAPQIGLAQGCPLEEGATEPGGPEVRTIQTRPPKPGAAKVRLA